MFKLKNEFQTCIHKGTATKAPRRLSRIIRIIQFNQSARLIVTQQLSVRVISRKYPDISELPADFQNSNSVRYPLSSYASKNNFIDLNVTDDVKGQVKSAIFDLLQVFLQLCHIKFLRANYHIPSIDNCFPSYIVLHVVIYTRSCHKGQVTKGHRIYKTLVGTCDTSFMTNFAFEIRWRGSFAQSDPFRQSSNQGQIKVRSNKVNF